MTVKYQVFISSVSRELMKYRRKLIDRLIRTGRYFPVAMENFTAHENTIRMLYGYLRDSDIYVLILRDEAGSEIGEKNAAVLRELAREDARIDDALRGFTESTALTAERLSFTQVEYILAGALGITTLSFVYKAEDGGSSAEARLRAFLGAGSAGAVMKWGDENELLDGIVSSLDRCVSDGEIEGWVRKSELPLYRAAEQAGILSIAKGSGFSQKLRQMLPRTEQLDLLYTTGRGIIVNNQAMLSEFIARGGSIRLLCGFPRQTFLSDVAAVETVKFGDRGDIHEEFLLVIQTLGHIYAAARAKRESEGLTAPMGRIFLGGAGTLFRSTIQICRMADQEMWGWLTITLPPEKSVDTISLELTGLADGGGSDSLMETAANHFNAVWRNAEENGEVFSIDDGTDFAGMNAACGKRLEPLGNREYWEKKWQAARRADRKRKGRRVLIEVAAQHPLRDGCEPDTEFAARLDFAARLYEQYRGRGVEAELYVPGSVHLDEDRIPDDVSLSEAGTAYLAALGIDPADLHGEDLNGRYDDRRAWTGVYNSGDECFVASQYFCEEERGFGTLVCVCSPNQVMRKMLFYLENGVLPLICSVPVKNMFHNFLSEIYEAVPNVLMTDPSCQEADSAEALRTRRERMPGFRG